MGIRHFPLPYPDELWYSVLARLRRDLGYPLVFHFHRLVFGDHYKSSRTLLFPRSVQTIKERLPTGYPLTTDQVIHHHSMWPFIAPFVSQEQGEALIEYMTVGTTSLRVFIIFSRILFGSYVDGLRFCPKCMAHDQSFNREPYWHRIHQWGLDVCPIHGIVMGRWLPPYKSFEWIPLKRAVRSCTFPRLSDAAIREQQRLAEGVAWLLDHGDSLGPAEKTVMRYKDVLESHGLTNANGGVRCNRLRTMIEQSISPELASSIAGKARTTYWTSVVFRYPKLKLHSVIRHRILMYALGVTVPGFFSDPIAHRSAFGSGPWACMNPVAPHYMQSTISTVTVIKNRKRLMGTFVCPQCRFTYKRWGPDESPATHAKIWVVERGPVWMEALKRMYADPDISGKEMERCLHACTEKIEGIARGLGLSQRLHTKDAILETLEQWAPDIRRMWSDPSLSLEDIAQYIGQSKHSISKYAPILGLPSRNKVRMQASKTLRRQQFLQIIENNPRANRRELRKSRAGAWLWKYDQEWMKDYLPPVRQISRKGNQVDWATRDRQVVELIPKAYDLLCRQNYGKPIKAATLLRMLHAHYGVKITYIMQRRLPLTQQAMESFVESHEQFAERRLRYAIQELQHQNVPVTRKALLQRFPYLIKTLKTAVGHRLLHNEFSAGPRVTGSTSI